MRIGKMLCSKKELLWASLLSILAAAGVLLFCTKSSPLYPTNDWVDTNCFFTVGKSMFEGRVPYLDIYEQKGPLLYFLYGLCYLVSPTSFFGGYLLETASAAATLFCFYLTIRLYTDKPAAALICLPFLALAIYSSASFAYGGSAEELCLPMTAYSVYALMKYLRYGKDSRPNGAMLVAVGLLAGAVLFIKFSMLGSYTAWIAYIAVVSLVRTKKFGELLRCCGLFLLGIALSAVPWALYFGINNAVGDFLTAYFYNNIFLYTGKSFGIIAMPFIAAYRTVRGSIANFGYALPILFGLIWFMFGMNRKLSKCERFAPAALFVFLMLGVFIGRGLPYYMLISASFAAIGAAAAISLSEPLINKLRADKRVWTAAASVSVAACIALSYLCTDNSYFMAYDRDDLPQNKFARIIASETDDADILFYGALDSGFYMPLRTVPEYRYFCRLNINLPEMYEEQDRYVMEGLPDYVVAGKRTIPQDAPYEPVATADYSYRGYDNLDVTFTLYRRIGGGNGASASAHRNALLLKAFAKRNKCLLFARG